MLCAENGCSINCAFAHTRMCIRGEISRSRITAYCTKRLGNPFHDRDEIPFKLVDI